MHVFKHSEFVYNGTSLFWEFPHFIIDSNIQEFIVWKKKCLKSSCYLSNGLERIFDAAISILLVSYFRPQSNTIHKYTIKVLGLSKGFFRPQSSTLRISIHDFGHMFLGRLF